MINLKRNNEYKKEGVAALVSSETLKITLIFLRQRYGFFMRISFKIC